MCNVPVKGYNIKWGHGGHQTSASSPPSQPARWVHTFERFRDFPGTPSSVIYTRLSYLVPLAGPLQQELILASTVTPKIITQPTFDANAFPAMCFPLPLLTWISVNQAALPLGTVPTRDKGSSESVSSRANFKNEEWILWMVINGLICSALYVGQGIRNHKFLFDLYNLNTSTSAVKQQ